MQAPYNVHKIFAKYFTGCESLAFALSSRLAEGHICIDIEDYKSELPTLLEEQRSKESFTDEDHKFWGSPEEFDLQCRYQDFVTEKEVEAKPFVVHKGKAYLHRYFQYETQIIDNIKRPALRLKIITGGPGSGKTTSVGKTLNELLTGSPELKIAMAAPTGKASARMNEAIRQFAEKPENKVTEGVRQKLTDIKAQTIHKLLGPIPNSVFFRHDKNNPLPLDVLVIDECSMIDGAMMAKLLSAVGDNTQLYLIGDKDQLASVEAGSVFGDLCSSMNTEYMLGKVSELTGSHRFDPGKGIGKLSREILGEDPPDLPAYANDDHVRIDPDHSEKLFREKAALYKTYIDSREPKDALKALQQIRFLCVTRQNEHSVEETNKRIENYLRWEYKNTDVFRPSAGLYHNQVILITRNDSILNVNNGDIALIREKDGGLVAHLESDGGEVREIPAGYLNHWETAFAMTIHKSQGSEFDNVVLILPEDRADKILTKELLYTGVTRAGDHVLIQASEDLILRSAAKKVSRTSGLQQRLRVI